MTLDEWLEEERRRLERFKKWWDEQNRQSPGMFPMDMDPGEWDEQYRIYDDTDSTF